MPVTTEELGRNKGFSGRLNVTGIKSVHPNLVSDFTKNGMDNLNAKQWCEFLYGIRCGLVHTKEGEQIFERTSDNEYVLVEYILTFLKELCKFLIEN